MRSTIFAFLSAVALAAKAVEPSLTFDLWPGTPPGEKEELGQEQDTTKATDNKVAGRPVIRLGNVNKPTLAIYRPDSQKDTGASVVVCPGGGYHILAMDLEGTEVCEWLNSIGVTGILLKYRVPKRPGLESHAAAVQDGQRAVSTIRHRAKELALDPNRIGILGFSAGGHLAAFVSTNFKDRSYAKVDEIDDVSSRPDFSILIYPAYLTLKEEKDKINPHLNVSSNTPPTIIAMAQDDPVRVETALFYTLALKNVKVGCELHVYPSGGHGYGLRPSKHLVTTWPDRVRDWLQNNHLLERR